MKILRSGLSIFVPIFVGSAVLFGLKFLPPLVRFEHLAFLYPERFQAETIFPDRGDLAGFQIHLSDFSADKDRQLNIGTYEIDDETRDIMGFEGGSPIEWAQFLKQTRFEGDRLTVLTFPLSWNDVEELPLLALQEQILATPNLVIGLKGELLNTEAPLADFLIDSQIPAESFSSLDLPEIDHIPVPPSVNAALFGISEIRGLKLRKEGEIHQVPMLVRWGDHVLPTLPLASLLTAQNMETSELTLAPGGYLRVGEDGVILKLDRQGCAPLLSSAATLQSASRLQIYPGQAETHKVLLRSDSPSSARLLMAQVTHALSQETRALKTYRRLHPAIEIAALILMALLLETRRFWIYLPAMAVLLGGATFFGYWLLFTPLLALTVTHLGMRMPNSRSRSRPRAKKTRLREMP